ncbi:MAG TPA: SAM-dependent chlorinase/fluorinase, partial [Candidatus Saccharimonadia bacterium]|nr:SAM-dependent chlorinase/fluorinase [Candidatus Saccharimonadia bacterium]
MPNPRRRFCRNLCEPSPLTRRNALSYYGCDEETRRAGQNFSTGPITVSYITLTTDFGASPGVMKGVIWRIAPSVQIADLSHTIRPQDVRQAAIVLARQVYYFP